MHLQIVKADRQFTGRYVANGPHCWAMWIGLTESRAVRAELTKRLDVKRPSIRARGHDRNTAPDILDGWASHTGRCEGATAEKAVPFPSGRPTSHCGIHDYAPRIGSRWVTASS